MATKIFLHEQNIIDTSKMSQQIPDQRSESLRIIRMRDLVKKTGMSRSLLYEKMREGSPAFDSSFPPKIFLHKTPGKGPVGFVEAHVEDWLMSIINSQISR